MKLHLRSLKRARQWAELRDAILEHLRLRPELSLYLEASKVCEHKTGERELALKLVERALLRLETISFHEQVRAELQHRRNRLLCKIANNRTTK